MPAELASPQTRSLHHLLPQALDASCTSFSVLVSEVTMNLVPLVPAGSGILLTTVYSEFIHGLLPHATKAVEAKTVAAKRIFLMRQGWQRQGRFRLGSGFSC